MKRDPKWDLLNGKPLVPGGGGGGGGSGLRPISARAAKAQGMEGRARLAEARQAGEHEAGHLDTVRRRTETSSVIAEEHERTGEAEPKRDMRPTRSTPKGDRVKRRGSLKTMLAQSEKRRGPKTTLSD